MSKTLAPKALLLMAGLLFSVQPAFAGHLTPAKVLARYHKLQRQLPRSRGAKRARLLARLARLDVANAYANFQGQQVLAGSVALNLAQQHAHQAMQTLAQEAARGKSKGMRKVELQFHKISFGLRGLLHIAPYEAAPRIRAVRDYFGQLRSRLLGWMFGGGALVSQKH